MKLARHHNFQFIVFVFISGPVIGSVMAVYSHCIGVGDRVAHRVGYGSVMGLVMGLVKRLVMESVMGWS